jgi:hypothetical protein
VLFGGQCTSHYSLGPRENRNTRFLTVVPRARRQSGDIWSAVSVDDRSPMHSPTMLWRQSAHRTYPPRVLAARRPLACARKAGKLFAVRSSFVCRIWITLNTQCRLKLAGTLRVTSLTFADPRHTLRGENTASTPGGRSNVPFADIPPITHQEVCMEG